MIILLNSRTNELTFLLKYVKSSNFSSNILKSHWNLKVLLFACFYFKPHHTQMDLTIEVCRMFFKKASCDFFNKHFSVVQQANVQYREAMWFLSTQPIHPHPHASYLLEKAQRAPAFKPASTRKAVYSSALKNP